MAPGSTVSRMAYMCVRKRYRIACPAESVARELLHTVALLPPIDSR